MGAKVGGKKGEAMGDINVTPLVDVVRIRTGERGEQAV